MLRDYLKAERTFYLRLHNSKMKNQRDKHINAITQIAMPVFTAAGYIITAMKYPEIGLIVNLCAQPFWFYSARKSYKEAGQYGLVIVTIIIITVILIGGIINYRFF
jgi:hypothetical protein